ncbi:hypothetical protein [Hyphomicrobium sp.]|uniref:hypothetical protein n=1 Tax=Hyphomicrobium sp. TaxID=82 RepID=UPI003F71C098
MSILQRYGLLEQPSFQNASADPTRDQWLLDQSGVESKKTLLPLDGYYGLDWWPAFEDQRREDMKYFPDTPPRPQR